MSATKEVRIDPLWSTSVFTSISVVWTCTVFDSYIGVMNNKKILIPFTTRKLQCTGRNFECKNATDCAGQSVHLAYPTAALVDRRGLQIGNPKRPTRDSLTVKIFIPFCQVMSRRPWSSFRLLPDAATEVTELWEQAIRVEITLTYLNPVPLQVTNFYDPKLSF